MQDPKEIDQFYKDHRDPWGYQDNLDDIIRRDYIVQIARFWGPYARCLDIGAGEGWITQSLPAEEIFGYELSDTAASRFPPVVQRVVKPSGKYDLVVATGVLYTHYDLGRLIGLIHDHSSAIVITSGIKAWEPAAIKLIGDEIFSAEFPYRDYVQKLRVFRR